MSVTSAKRSVAALWIALGAVALLCAILATLQYRWIGQVTDAERARLHDDVQSELFNVSRTFNRQIEEALRDATPDAPSPVFSRLEITHLPPRRNPPNTVGRFDGDRSLQPTWLLAEINLDWARKTSLPAILASANLSEFDVQVLDNSSPPGLVYSSGPATILSDPDASAPILDSPGRGPGGRGPGPDPRPAPRAGRRGPPPGEPGLWRIMARHKNISLKTVVANTQRRNLAVSGAILLLIIAIAGMLIRLTRRAQLLADSHLGFVAGVSHELRTPLTVIRTAAFNLTSGKIQARPEQIERYGRLITDETRKLEALVDQVLRFASGRAGHAVRDLRPVAIATLIEEEVKALEPAAEKDSVAIRIHIEPALPPVLADDVALRQAIRNLLDNALRYGREGGEIAISAKRATLPGVSRNDTDAVEIEVADRGPGIPPEELNRIFEPFFRGSRAVSDQIHGTGLGLNIVRTIARAHSGTVTVTSKPGEGTHFFLRIPCAQNLST
jgi:signal transduction histidine kinase